MRPNFPDELGDLLVPVLPEPEVPRGGREVRVEDHGDTRRKDCVEHHRIGYTQVYGLPIGLHRNPRRVLAQVTPPGEDMRHGDGARFNCFHGQPHARVVRVQESLGTSRIHRYLRRYIKISQWRGSENAEPVVVRPRLRPPVRARYEIGWRPERHYRLLSINTATA